MSVEESTRHLVNTALSLQSKGVCVSSVKKACEALLDDKQPAALHTYLQGVETIVTDIEGTTTPIPFVTSVLFPYALEHVENFLKQNYEQSTEQINSMRTEAAKAAQTQPETPLIKDSTHSKEEIIATVVANFKYNSDKNLKVTPMKALQGMIWKNGYASGNLKGKIFNDVAPAFRRWKEQGKKVAIYSSGSIPAQKLLFGNSSDGDLLDLLCGYYDTTTGSKREASSYTAIAASLNAPPSSILFLTDMVPEATAALAAGYKTILLNRPENLLLSVDDQKNSEGILQILDFDCLFPDREAKRRKKE
eukprot:TRINITY_DN37318_c0_g1_i1.p1 TRINITY_DN37318_c0_g1~~TRINITY_DN37318_c0_g1_i1.p1  ORF type:complete len:314 (+),score=45.91 TRINITY_DN37318_c0_g1_i1:25-942(+)